MSGSIQNKRVKAKILVLSLLVSFFSTISFQHANATDGAGVWAVVDSSGTVTNVIVCTQAVCGGGTIGGQRVVPQIAPNPITNDATGQGSFIGNGIDTRVTESNGTFTIHQESTINKIEIEENVENKTTVTSTVNIPVSSRSFRYEDTIGKTFEEIVPVVKSYNDEKPTKLSVTKETSSSLSFESISIVGRKSASELDIILFQNETNLLLSKINVLLRLLGSWVK
jgi:hypothetical protein